ncbi:ECs_2282 family putative zinc-binding protein [Photorhabdus sp. S10-54]|uniref:ECs_2282 family putative zinc-binding protein n=1 Tax=unclassified Photorhabdus TaxID=2620880 RepID=UPI00403F5E90
MTTKISCPKCGNEIIKATAKINSLDDMSDTVCINCGHSIDKDEVVAQAKKHAIELIRKAIRKP